MPIRVFKDSKTMIVAKVVPRKGVGSYAVEVAKKTIVQLGYRRVKFRSDS